MKAGNEAIAVIGLLTLPVTAAGFSPLEETQDIAAVAETESGQESGENTAAATSKFVRPFH